MTKKILEFAERTARDAGAILMKHFAALEPDEILHKGEIDLVTRADLDSERHIVAALRERFPDHTIGAEEEVCEEPGKRHWIVDPLDGTTNYAHSIPLFCVSMAFLEEGRAMAAVVHAPYLDETFTAMRGGGAFLNGREIQVSTRMALRESVLATGFHYQRRTVNDNNVKAFNRFILEVRGLRRMGSAAIDMSYVACGRLDAFWEPHLSPHDMAAGALIVEEAGGKVTDYLGGRDYLAMRRIVASNGRLHDRVLDRLEYIE
jgi:myo-inositol-1(or 4)-monophosphatase